MKIILSNWPFVKEIILTKKCKVNVPIVFMGIIVWEREREWETVGDDDDDDEEEEEKKKEKKGKERRGEERKFEWDEVYGLKMTGVFIPID